MVIDVSDQAILLTAYGMFANELWH